MKVKIEKFKVKVDELKIKVYKIKKNKTEIQQYPLSFGWTWFILRS